MTQRGSSRFTVAARSSGSGLLTRREFVARAGVTLADLAGAGVLGEPAQAAPRFPDAGEFDASVPLAWFDLALDLVEQTPGYSPLVASRAFGYAGVTLYEAIVPGMDGYRSVLPNMPAAGRNEAYDWSPTRRWRRSCGACSRPDQRRSSRPWLRWRHGLAAGLGFHQEYARARSGGDVKWQRPLFAQSRSDGGHEGYLHNFPPYDSAVGPGYWVPTPSGFPPALQPFWGSNRCLAVPDGAACYPGTTPTPPGHSISITTHARTQTATGGTAQAGSTQPEPGPHTGRR